jgi:transposase
MEWVIVSTMDSGHLEVGDGGEKGLKKRIWSGDEKRMICAQTLMPGVSVAQVARRYSMNANLIFKRLKDSRFAPEEGGPSSEESIALEGVFLPVEIKTPAVESHTTPALPSGVAAVPGPAVLAQRVEIVLSDGRRILVGSPTSLASVVGLKHPAFNLQHIRQP